jgi:hypothetical protein
MELVDLGVHKAVDTDLFSVLFIRGFYPSICMLYPIKKLWLKTNGN